MNNRKEESRKKEEEAGRAQYYKSLGLSLLYFTLRIYTYIYIYICSILGRFTTRRSILGRAFDIDFVLSGLTNDRSTATVIHLEKYAESVPSHGVRWVASFIRPTALMLHIKVPSKLLGTVPDVAADASPPSARLTGNILLVSKQPPASSHCLSPSLFDKTPLSPFRFLLVLFNLLCAGEIWVPIPWR